MVFLQLSPRLDFTASNAEFNRFILRIIANSPLIIIGLLTIIATDAFGAIDRVISAVWRAVRSSKSTDKD